MDRESVRRLLWVVSLVAAVAASTWILIRHGAEWGLGAAP
jgi:hypothetical protein